MANFTVVGEPRFQSPPTPFRTEVNGKPAVATHAGFRQFEWLARVTQSVASPDALEVGLIQNMLVCSIELLYSDGPKDSSPVKARFEVSPLPILDSKVVGAVWLGGNFAVLGTNTVDPKEILPPGFARTVSNSSAAVNGGDDPGGRFPITHPQQPTKLLRQVSEHLDFTTWIAVRKKARSASDVMSYEFLKNLNWVVRRTIIVHQNPTGTFAAAYTENSTKMTSPPGMGMGSKTPILGGSIANQAGKFTGILIP